LRKKYRRWEQVSTPRGAVQGSTVQKFKVGFIRRRFQWSQRFARFQSFNRCAPFKSWANEERFQPFQSFHRFASFKQF